MGIGRTCIFLAGLFQFIFNGPEALANLYVEAGVYVPHPYYTTVDSLGNTSFLKPRYLLTGPRGSFRFSDRLTLEPSVRVALPWQSNVDGTQKTYTSLFSFDMGYFVASYFELRGGVGFQWEYTYGNGGSVTQKNGTSTSVFYTPAVSQSTWIASIDLGLSLILLGPLRVSFDTFTWDVMSRTSRYVGFYLGAGYAIF